MASLSIGLLHPGEMGATLGAALAASGHQVHWAPEGRSPKTAQRAAATGLVRQPSLSALAGAADAIISVCPPHAALDVAQAVMQAGFSGLYLDANAVSPQTGQEIAALVGDNYVAGGIVGPPARRQGTTRLYLSGPHAAVAAGWFSAGPLAAAPLTGGLNAAKALKMCYAAYTKGVGALLLAIRALAEANGVTDALLMEWNRSQPDLAQRSEGAAGAAVPKAWRFAGEMHEIAATFAAADLPPGFHHAAATIYERLADLKNSGRPTLQDAVQRLLR